MRESMRMWEGERCWWGRPLLNPSIRFQKLTLIRPTLYLQEFPALPDPHIFFFFRPECILIFSLNRPSNLDTRAMLWQVLNSTASFPHVSLHHISPRFLASHMWFTDSPTGRASFLAFLPEINVPNITAHILRTLRAFRRKIIQVILGFWLSEGTKWQLH